MKLYFNEKSPFVRKVLIVARERGLAARLELVQIAVVPTEPNAVIAGDNPLMKVPTLVLSDGAALYDSRVIAEYLDSLDGPSLFPAAGPKRWEALRRQAQADGLLDAANLINYERVVRPPQKLYTAWIDGQWAKINGVLNALEQEAPNLGADFSIGNIAIACALGYLDSRFSEEDWREGRPALAAYYAEIGQRPSVLATRPD